MEKDRIIEHIEGFAIEVHKCLNRLKDIEDDSLPNIELGLLEHKVILFYDQIQQLKEQNLAVGKKAETTNEVDAIKAQFESLKTEFSNELAVEQQEEAPAAVKEEAQEMEEEPVPISDIEVEPEAEAIEADTDEELNKVLEQAEQLVEEAPPIKWEIEAEPVKPEDIPLELEEAVNEKVVAQAETKVETAEAPIIEEEPAPVIEPEAQAPVEEESEEEELSEEEKTTSLNDRFSAQKTSLHDKLSAQREKQKILSKQLSGKPIRDLKKAINLNMQIRFTKELFENDKRSFKRTVDFINKCNTYSEARSYAHNEVMVKYELNEDNKFYTEFMALVKRRFI